ncbi:hypothetical protein PG996_006455 [Apiospora saccharicola]|uniref:Phosphatidylinositol transfer protein SFH5 n=1 Tax=Apiospora saccharicola TaxID=335842 RepID=A0ABR1VPM8_9PEZI
MADTETKPLEAPAAATRPESVGNIAATLTMPTSESAEKPATEDPTGAPAKTESSETEKAAKAGEEEDPAKVETATVTAVPSKTDEGAQEETSSTPDAERPSLDIQELYLAAKVHGHPEIWGVTLQDPAHHVPSQIVFQKYLNANDGVLAKAKEQLTKTLEWRAQTKPLDLTKQTWSQAKFDKLGYVTTYCREENDASSSQQGSGAEGKEVFTWNVYGNVQDMNVTFGDRDEFIQWRVALMELAMEELDISSATQPITGSWDPYKIYQVHDYKSVSFLRQNPKVKAAVRETVTIFGQNYPELLKQKFFVNVPAIMGWFYAAVKVFIAKKTAEKFHPMGNGANMAGEFASPNQTKVLRLSVKLPQQYGGQGEGLDVQGKQTLLE